MCSAAARPRQGRSDRPADRQRPPFGALRLRLRQGGAGPHAAERPAVARRAYGDDRDDRRRHHDLRRRARPSAPPRSRPRCRTSRSTASATTASARICSARGGRVRTPIPGCRSRPTTSSWRSFTSGTTGTLKAAEHTQATYGAVVHNVLTNLIDPAPGEIMLHAASMIHASGCFVLPYWLRGGTAAILPGFAPASYIEAIERWRPTALNLVPTMLQMLFQCPASTPPISPRSRRSSTAPRRCRGRCSSGRSALWGPVFVQYYGQTEAPLAICASARRTMSAPRPSGCSPAAGRASNARSGWSTRRARTCPPASPARSCCARPSR